MTTTPLNALPVYEKDSFLFFKKKNEADYSTDQLIINVSKIDLIADYMQKNDLKNITVNSRYFPVDDLEFLKKLPFIERISIVDNDHDITPINNLHQLRQIGIGEPKNTIDFNNFPYLEDLGISWSEKIKNIENATNLKSLWLSKYKATSLERFKNFNKLTFLYLYLPSIISLKGIDGLYSLKELNIDTASKLESLEGLNEKLSNLECLYIYSSKNLHDYSLISKIVSLKQLELRKTGDAESINFLSKLTNLKKVVLGFKVVDGNMNYLKGIENVGFIDFAHYSHKMKDFK